MTNPAPTTTEPTPLVLTLREDWLTQLLDRSVRDHFSRAGYKVPENIRLTCGFPSRAGLSKKNRTIGQCWDASASEDGKFQISVSPTLSDPIKVGGVIVHEVVHAVVGLKCGHKGPFSKCATAVGLTKPWTATGETDELKASIRDWTAPIGGYPHGALSVVSQSKEVGRMLLLQCGCGLKIRTTQKWIDEYGPEWPCPCGLKLVVPENKGEGE